MYTITENQVFNSLEVSFAEKPGESVRAALKALGYRWNRQRKIWYGFSSREDLEKALSGENAGNTETRPGKTENGTSRRALLSRYREALEAGPWKGDERMVEYCMKQIAEITEIPGVGLVTVEKQRIKTRFCFGYSDSRYDTEDYDRANDMAHYARTSEDYFRRENMADFTEMIQAIEPGEAQEFFVIRPAYGEENNSPLQTLEFMRLSRFLDYMGGSAYMEELPGTFAELSDGRRVYIPTDDDRRRIAETYKKAAEAHRKKVENYLKRYGLSKVNAWSYWRDE